MQGMRREECIGTLTRDAKLFEDDKSARCLFSIAVNRKFGTAESVEYIDCVLWGKRGQKLAQYLTKGTNVYISGDAENKSREYKGKETWYTSVRVDTICLLGGKRRREESEPASDDDIPF